MAQNDVESAVSAAVADMDGAEAKDFLNKMSVMYKIDTMEQMRRERDRLKQFYHKQKDKDRRLRTWVNLMAERLEQSGSDANASYAKQLRVVIAKLNSIDTDSRNTDGKSEEQDSDESGEDITKHPQLLDESAIALACEGLGRSELYAVEHQLHRMKDLHEAEEIERQMRNMTTIIKQLYRRDTRMLQCMEVLGTQLQASGDHKLWIDTYQSMAQRCGTDEASINNKEKAAVGKQIELDRSQMDLAAGAGGAKGGLTRTLSRSLSNLSRSLSNLSASNGSAPGGSGNDGANTGTNTGTRSGRGPGQAQAQAQAGASGEAGDSKQSTSFREANERGSTSRRTSASQTNGQGDAAAKAKAEAEDVDVYGGDRPNGLSNASAAVGSSGTGIVRARRRSSEMARASDSARSSRDGDASPARDTRRSSRHARTQSRERPRLGSRTSTGSSASTRSRDGGDTHTRTRKESQQSNAEYGKGGVRERRSVGVNSQDDGVMGTELTTGITATERALSATNAAESSASSTPSDETAHSTADETGASSTTESAVESTADATLESVTDTAVETCIANTTGPGTAETTGNEAAGVAEERTAEAPTYTAELDTACAPVESATGTAEGSIVDPVMKNATDATVDSRADTAVEYTTNPAEKDTDDEPVENATATDTPVKIAEDPAGESPVDTVEQRTTGMAVDDSTDTAVESSPAAIADSTDKASARVTAESDHDDCDAVERRGS